MMRKFLSAATAMALVVGSVTPAFAQSNYAAFQAPPGAMATINLKVPLGAATEQAKKPNYGLTLAYGQELDMLTLDERQAVRSMPMIDVRFTGPLKLQKAEVMTFDLANLKDDKRLKLMGEGDNTLWIVVGLVAAGVAICLLADCFEGDDDNNDDEDDEESPVLD